MSSDETWRPIPTEPGYEASTLGRVRSVDRVVMTARGPQRHRGRVRAQHEQGDYLYVWLPGGRNRSVHRLVAEAFHGPLPAGRETRHRNGDHHDNRPTNLHYGTPSDNRYDSVRHGTHARHRARLARERR